MPTLDQYQSQVGVPQQVGGQVSPGIASQGEAVAGLHALSGALATSAAAVSAHEYRMQRIEETQRAAAALAGLHEAFADLERDQRGRLGTTDERGEPLSPRMLADDFRKAAHHVYQRAVSDSRAQGAQYSKFFTTHATTMYATKIGDFVKSMEKPYADYLQSEYLAKSARLQRAAMKASSKEDRDYNLGLLQGLARTNATVVGAELAQKTLNDAEQNVLMSEGLKWVRGHAAEWMDATWQGTTPADFPIHPSRLSADGFTKLTEAASSAITARITAADQARFVEEQRHARNALAAKNTFISRAIDGGEAASKLIHEVSHPDTRFTLGKEYDNVIALLRDIDKQQRFPIQTDQKLYQELLILIGHDTYAEWGDIPQVDRDRVAIPQINELVSAMKRARDERDKHQHRAFQSGLDYITRLLGFTDTLDFRDPSRMHSAEIQAQFTSWYLAPTRLDAKPDVIYQKAVEVANERFKTRLPSLLFVTESMFTKLKYKTPAEIDLAIDAKIIPRESRTRYLREIDEYREFKRHTEQSQSLTQEHNRPSTKSTSPLTK